MTIDGHDLGSGRSLLWAWRSSFGVGPEARPRFPSGAVAVWVDGQTRIEG